MLMGADLINRGGKKPVQDIKRLLAKYGAARISNLSPEQLPAFIEELAPLLERKTKLSWKWRPRV